MKICINPGPRSGFIEAPASKSQCNRLFLLSALGNRKVNIECGGLSNDLRAILDCLKALGSQIEEPEKGVFSVSPMCCSRNQSAKLFCGESGSCLRFLLPAVGVQGAEACFYMEGRLSERPMEDFISELTGHGMSIEKAGNKLFCTGKLQSGSYILPGSCSSQFISALLMTLPLLEGDSRLTVEGELQSAPYVAMSEEALRLAGIKLIKSENYYLIPGKQKINLPENIKAQGDYSSAAFFLCMGALSPEGIEVGNLPLNTSQGDREIINILRRMGADISVSGDSLKVRSGSLRAAVLDASQIPDLVPAFAALAALAEGESRVINGERLRLKESDRIKTCCLMLRSLGADIEELPDGLLIRGRKSLSGGMTQSFSDHRIAMAAAVAACGAENEVIIDNAEAVNKSYPDFWKDFGSLKEQK